MSKSELFNSKDGSEEYLKTKNDRKYKEWVESLHDNCYQYLPKDFSKNFQYDSGKTNSLIWEMLLANKLLENGFKLDKQKSSNSPDLCILDTDIKIWLECVMPNRGTPDDLPQISHGKRIAQSININGNILRCTSSITEKVKQHQKRIEKGICKENDPLIIPIHGKNLDLAIHSNMLPDITKAVYPIGKMTVAFDKNSNVVTEGYQSQYIIIKKNKSLVSTDNFLIYLVYYSQMTGIGHLAPLQDIHMYLMFMLLTQ